MTIVVDTRYCHTCNQELPTDQFYPSDLYKCKKCRIRLTCDNRGCIPMSENKQCSNYLGLVIAEPILKEYFENIIKAPTKQHGYDWTCSKGYKIDVKGSSLNDGTYYWKFNIRRNTIADYFLCIAFNNRSDLMPIHIWLIPGNVINHLVAFTIRDTPKKLEYWSKYEKPIDKAVEWCDKL